MNALGSTKAPSGVPEQNWWDSSEIRTFADIPKKGPISEETASRMRHGYYAATSYADANIGKALDALEESGAADNTIIVLWSDHGYHLGENSQWAKVTVRELDARVPLIISIPGGQSGSTKALVESIDLYPTLSELCGLPASEAIDGRSFKSVLSNSNSSFRSAALTQVCRPWSNKAPIEQMAYSIRTDQHRYTQWLDFETNELIAEELYAIENDLLQRDNLATSSPERLSNFRSLINQTLNSPTNPSP
jgi:iduronate 2-sulfatase